MNLSQEATLSSVWVFEMRLFEMPWRPSEQVIVVRSQPTAQLCESHTHKHFVVSDEKHHTLGGRGAEAVRSEAQ